MQVGMTKDKKMDDERNQVWERGRLKLAHFQEARSGQLIQMAAEL